MSSDEEFSFLIRRIRQEWAEIERILARIHSGWDRAQRSNDEYYIDGVALNLHSLYSGFERIFTQVAENVDDNLPGGANWHELLLNQMMREVPGIRPAVISTETGLLLDELRRFRHIVRNVYAHNFNPENIEKLIRLTSVAINRLNAELCAFTDFLEQA
jgi:hypothetical protein